MKLFVITLFFLSFLGIVGCAGPLNETKIQLMREKNLLTAGFKKVPLTEAQEAQLRGFSANKITAIQRDGKDYYIYPDLKNHCILVGSNRKFTQYNELVAEQLTPAYKKVFHKSRQEELEWAESGAWDN